MSRQRDLLVNFERMWREMDELVEENSRFSCQLIMTEELNGLEITLAPGTQKDSVAA